MYINVKDLSFVINLMHPCWKKFDHKLTTIFISCQISKTPNWIFCYALQRQANLSMTSVMINSLHSIKQCIIMVPILSCVKVKNRMQVLVQLTVRNQQWLLHVSVRAITKMHTPLPAAQHLNHLWLIFHVKVLLFKLQPLSQKKVSIF